MHAVDRIGRPAREWWRVALCLVGLAVYVGCALLSPRDVPAVHWLGGAELGLCSMVVSFLLLTGAPRREAPADRSHHPVVRALRLVAHPLVAAVVNCLALVLVFSSGWYDRAVSSGPGWAGLLAFVLFMGLLADAGVLVPGLLPQLGPGLQVLFATAAGLVDELPGILAMVLHHHDAGVAMWVVAQPVIIPVLVLLMVRWVRADRDQARLLDAQLDAEEAAGPAPWMMGATPHHE